MRKPTACKTIDEIILGERAQVDYQIKDADIRAFAELSGDFNPVHFDETYAKRSIFKRRIAHGTISVAKFSGIFGMTLPGLGAVWERQEIDFAKPVYLYEWYSAVVEVTEKDERRVRFDTWVEDKNGQRVLSGRASVIPISPIVRRRIEASLASLIDADP